MIDISKGRYWDLPWSLVSGCTPCSPGCEHCWSASMAHRFCRTKAIGQGAPGSPLLTEGNGKFNGKIWMNEKLLNFPLKIKKPTVFAVWNDLFHEKVSEPFIRSVFTLMTHVNIQKHTFLVLTKRPEIMAPAMNGLWSDTENEIRFFMPQTWAGLTVCNQAEADEKLPIFLQVPGKKLLSIEPCLGEIKNLDYIYLPKGIRGDFPIGHETYAPAGAYLAERNQYGAVSVRAQNGKMLGIKPDEFKPAIDAVILGGESGPGARPLHPDWVRTVRDQCAASNTPFFFKSWGEWAPETYCEKCAEAFKPVHEFPDGIKVTKVGKNKAGRLLDGREHNELPWVKP